MPPYRITLFADDETGLLPEEVFAVLEHLLSGFKLTLVEVALDFDGEKIDRTYIRRHCLPGRSQPKPSRHETDYWGTPRGSKLVKAYWKKEIRRFRLELELRSRFLRRHKIKDPYDFETFAQLIPHDHIRFAKIDDLKLVALLRRRRFTADEILDVCREVNRRKKSIHAALSYLRRKVHITNARRVLTPLRTNQLVREGLEHWSALWAQR